MVDLDVEKMIAATRSDVESMQIPMPAKLKRRVRVRRFSRLATQGGAVLITASVLLVVGAWVWPSPHEIAPGHPGSPGELHAAASSEESMTLLAIRLGGDRIDQATRLRVLPGGRGAILTPTSWGRVPQ